MTVGSNRLEERSSPRDLVHDVIQAQGRAMATDRTTEFIYTVEGKKVFRQALGGTKTVVTDADEIQKALTSEQMTELVQARMGDVWEG